MHKPVRTKSQKKMDGKRARETMETSVSDVARQIFKRKAYTTWTNNNELKKE